MGGIEGTVWANSDVTTIAPILVSFVGRLTIRYILFDPGDVLAVCSLGLAKRWICIFAYGGTYAEQDEDCNWEAQRIELEDDSG